MSRFEIRDQARDRWEYILSSLGVDPGYLRNRHMPCPGCGGHDRFRYDDKEGKGTFYCGGGGDPISGDGFELLAHVHGWEFRTAANEVRRVLGIDAPAGEGIRIPVKPIENKRHDTASKPARTRAYALDLWEKADRTDSQVATHPYAIKKDVAWAAGAGRGRVSGRLVGKGADCLIVPQRTLQGDLIGVECINPEGAKQSFGKKGILILGNTLDEALPIYVVEGWADGCATWRHFGNVVAMVVFGMGRQERLAKQLHESMPGREMVIVEDASCH